MRLRQRIVLRSALPIRSTLTLQLAGDFLKLIVRQSDLSKNCGDGVTRDSFEMLCQRHNKYSAQINRCRTDRQFVRMKGLWPVFSSRKQICDPFPSLMKDRDVDQRFYPSASRFREQIDGTIHSMDQSRSIPPAKQEHISCVIRNRDASQSSGVLLDRKQSSRACLKVHVVWCGCSAFRAVIDDEISSEGCSNVEHISELVRDALQAVFSVSNRQMMIHDWKRIAVDREGLIELQTLFLRRQVPRTQEAGTFRDRLPVDRRRCATHTMGNVTDEEVDQIDPYRPCLRARKAFNAFREQRPCPRLPFEQFFYFVDHRRIRSEERRVGKKW